MARYFRSYTPQIYVASTTGRSLRFSPGFGSEGWLVLDEDQTADIKAVENCIAKGIGGQIQESNQATYEAWKKKVGNRMPPKPERESLTPAKLAGAPDTTARVQDRPTAPRDRNPVAADGGTETKTVTTIAPPKVVRRGGKTQ